MHESPCESGLETLPLVLSLDLLDKVSSRWRSKGGLWTTLYHVQAPMRAEKAGNKMLTKQVLTP